MKKLKIVGMAVLTAGLISLTSCLGDGSNTQTGVSLGYSTINLDALAYAVEDDFGTVVVADAFEKQLKGNEYVMYSYEVDWAKQSSEKYIYVNVTGLEKLPEVSSKMSITDTTSVLPNELPIEVIELAMYNYMYILTANRHAFLTAYHKNVPSDIETDYDLSYDIDANPVEISGVRVYDLYLRAVKITDGKKVATDTPIMCAYDLKEFLRRKREVEKSAGKTNVNVRFNYVSSITDSGSMTWKKSDVHSFVIPEEVSNY
ncbi:MAG: hypothetical protein IJD84_00725 [Parabacteroides sp.]|nr:hypothetical protein [Parabacteroides sp.]